jgi:glycosyltransferase involved in cell wall biosynthesis
MRILYYSPHPNLNLSDPAGYGTHMREMIQAFRAAGHEVLPVIMGGTEPKPSTLPAKPSLFKRIAKRLIPQKRWETLKDRRLKDFDEEAYLRLTEEIQRFRPDFIYERANYMQASGVRAAKRQGIMHVLEMNSPYVEEKLELEGPSDMLEEARQREHEQLSKSGHIVVVSSALRDYFIEVHGTFRAKFTVLPNAIDPAKLQADPAQVAAVQARYNLAGKTVLGWVGSIQPWHGVDAMIAAFAQVAASRPDLALLIVGSGETIADVQAKAAASGVGDRIHFSGYLPHAEVFTHLAAMDICLLPSTKWYCSPIKIFEYGAMGKAVIATDHAAVLDVMLPGQDGLVVPHADPAALAAAMAQLADDPALRRQMAQQFHEKVLRSHTWAANAARVLDLHRTARTSIPRA